MTDHPDHPYVATLAEYDAWAHDPVDRRPPNRLVKALARALRASFRAIDHWHETAQAEEARADKAEADRDRLAAELNEAGKARSHAELRASEAVADRDRLAARVETLEGVVRRTIDGIWKYGERADGSRAWRRDSYYPPVWEPVTPAEAAAIRAALVAPDAPTSPTDTTAGDDEYGDGAAAFVRERMATNPTDTGDER